MPQFAIDGKFLTQAVTGTQRYSREIVRELDNLVEPGRIVLAVPDTPSTAIDDQPALNSIEIVHIPSPGGQIWTNVDLTRFCRRARAIPVALNNIAPFFMRSVTVLHDISPLVNRGFYGARYRALAATAARANSARAVAIITVSEFSRHEIERHLPAARGKITVIPGSWEHVTRTMPDDEVFRRHPQLADGNFYFSLSSLAPNKNLGWLLKTAAANPHVTIAVAGGINTKVYGSQQVPQLPNLHYLGYVTDAESKSLMKRCQGFLFPTFYEGFGLPPMEALAAGARIAVSDTPCMHEIYRDAAHYIDPDVPSSDLEQAFSTPVGDPFSIVLSRFSWATSAQRLLSVLEEVS